MREKKILSLEELIKPLRNSIKGRKEKAGPGTVKREKIQDRDNTGNNIKMKIERPQRREEINKEKPEDIKETPVANRTPGQEGKWALVLMGGGARALAHIGVLEVLLDNDLVPPIITGTSMGAIIGGLFAAGYLPPELEKLGRQLSYGRLSGLRRSKIPIPDKLVDYLMLESYQKRLLRRIGVKKEKLLEEHLRELVDDVLIEELPVRFGCNAVDLVSGQEVNFTSGPLHLALRASMAFPFVIEPARFSGRLLVDGGLLNNCPIRLARELGATRVFVPDVHRPADAYHRIKNLDRRLGLCLDIGHAARAGVDPAEATRKFSDRLLDVHIKDVSAASREGQTVEIGRGVIDIKSFLKAIIAINYCGTLAFEFEKDEKDPLPGVAESVGYVRALLS